MKKNIFYILVLFGFITNLWADEKTCSRSSEDSFAKENELNCRALNVVSKINDDEGKDDNKKYPKKVSSAYDKLINELKEKKEKYEKIKNLSATQQAAKKQLEDEINFLISKKDEIVSNLSKKCKDGKPKFSIRHYQIKQEDSKNRYYFNCRTEERPVSASVILHQNNSNEDNDIEENSIPRLDLTFARKGDVFQDNSTELNSRFNDEIKILKDSIDSQKGVKLKKIRVYACASMVRNCPNANESKFCKDYFKNGRSNEAESFFELSLERAKSVKEETCKKLGLSIEDCVEKVVIDNDNLASDDDIYPNPLDNSKISDDPQVQALLKGTCGPPMLGDQFWGEQCKNYWKEEFKPQKGVCYSPFVKACLAIKEHYSNKDVIDKVKEAAGLEDNSEIKDFKSLLNVLNKMKKEKKEDIYKNFRYFALVPEFESNSSGNENSKNQAFSDTFDYQLKDNKTFKVEMCNYIQYSCSKGAIKNHSKGSPVSKLPRPKKGTPPTACPKW